MRKKTFRFGLRIMMFSIFISASVGIACMVIYKKKQIKTWTNHFFLTIKYAKKNSSHLNKYWYFLYIYMFLLFVQSRQKTTTPTLINHNKNGIIFNVLSQLNKFFLDVLFVQEFLICSQKKKKIAKIYDYNKTFKLFTSYM